MTKDIYLWSLLLHESMLCRFGEINDRYLTMEYKMEILMQITFSDITYLRDFMVDESSPAKSSLKSTPEYYSNLLPKREQIKAGTSLRSTVWSLPLVPGRSQQNWHFCEYVLAQWWLLSYLPKNLERQSQNAPQSMPALTGEEVQIVASLPPGNCYKARRRYLLEFNKNYQDCKCFT